MFNCKRCTHRHSHIHAHRAYKNVLTHVSIRRHANSYAYARAQYLRISTRRHILTARRVDNIPKKPHGWTRMDKLNQPKARCLQALNRGEVSNQRGLQSCANAALAQYIHPLQCKQRMRRILRVSSTRRIQNMRHVHAVNSTIVRSMRHSVPLSPHFNLTSSFW